jgi:hypothetical protein
MSRVVRSLIGLALSTGLTGFLADLGRKHTYPGQPEEPRSQPNLRAKRKRKAERPAWRK